MVKNKRQKKRGPKPRGKEYPDIFAVVCKKSQKHMAYLIAQKMGMSASEWARARMFPEGWERSYGQLCQELGAKAVE